MAFIFLYTLFSISSISVHTYHLVGVHTYHLGGETTCYLIMEVISNIPTTPLATFWRFQNLLVFFGLMHQVNPRIHTKHIPNVISKNSLELLCFWKMLRVPYGSRSIHFITGNLLHNRRRCERRAKKTSLFLCWRSTGGTLSAPCCRQRILWTPRPPHTSDFSSDFLAIALSITIQYMQI
jgi:hypothetical protein